MFILVLQIEISMCHNSISSVETTAVNSFHLSADRSTVHEKSSHRLKRISNLNGATHKFKIQKEDIISPSHNIANTSDLKYNHGVRFEQRMLEDIGSSIIGSTTEALANLLSGKLFLQSWVLYFVLCKQIN